MTVPTMKWVMSDDGQWVRRCFDLTITPAGKSDTPAASLNLSRKEAPNAQDHARR